MIHPLLRHGGLYAITNGPRDDLLDVVGAALRGGARLLQYRDKTDDTERRLREARALVALCARHGVPVIINDDVGLAARSGAAGVHLGESDAGIAEARAALGANAVVGMSCHDSIGRARAAAAAGADYLAFGAFFPSPSKPGARRARMALPAEAKSLGLPVVAIGGITPDNGGSLVAAGADFLAVISALFDASGVEAAARAFAGLFDTPT